MGDGHHTQITPDGIELCSGPPCPNLRVLYKNELAAHGELASQMERLDTMRKIAARLDEAGKPDAAFAKRISREAGDLQKKLQAAKAGQFTPSKPLSQTQAATSQKPTAAAKAGSSPADETSFKGLIDPKKYSNDPEIIDRLSRAREFDIGGYHSLTGKGEFGRVKDYLDSDEALQNAYIRMMKDVNRSSAATKNNPAIALSKGKHQQIKNLKMPDMENMTPYQVLDWHLKQMKDIAPDFVIKELRKEAEIFIAANF